MGITFTNNWKNIADKLRSTFRTEFKGALPVYINDENVSTGGQYLQLDLASTSLSEKMLGCELREYTVNFSYIFQSPNVKKSSLDHVLRYTSRIEQLMQNNTSLSLTDSTTAVNCRIESTELQEGEDNSYLVSFDWKCQHLSGLSEVIDTTPVTFYNTYSLNFDGSNDYVDTGFQPDFIHTNATMSYWVKLNDFVSMQTMGCHNTKRFYLGFNTTSAMFGVANAAKTSTDVSSYISTDTWIHLCLVAEGGTAKYYINGVERDSNTYTQSSGNNPDTNFLIGATSHTSTSYYMEGNIDEVAIWDTALDADAVAAIYNSGTPTDLKVNSGDYDNSSNLQGYWRMGDGTLDEYPLIADQTNATMGSNLVDEDDFSLGAGWSDTGTNSWSFTSGSYTNLLASNISGVTIGKLYKAEWTIGSNPDSVQLKWVGVNMFNAGAALDTSVGTHTHYGIATTDDFGFRWKGTSGTLTISDIKLQEVQGNAGLMTNMASGDIEEDTP